MPSRKKRMPSRKKRSGGYKFRDADIHEAVNLWFSNKAEAETQYGHISEWDVSSVTNMKELFEWKTQFNEDISSWDVSNVTDMGEMFYYAVAFN